MPRHNVISPEPVAQVDPPVKTASASRGNASATAQQARHLSSASTPDVVGPSVLATQQRGEYGDRQGLQFETPRSLPIDRSSTYVPAAFTPAAISSAGNVIWDWEAPPGQPGGTHSNYYESQGELLQQNSNACNRGPSAEFSIPHPVAGSIVNWPFSATAPSGRARDALVVPRHHTIPGTSSARGMPAGSKRKSTTELPVNAGQPHQKRTSRIMSTTSSESPTPMAQSSAMDTTIQDENIPGTERAASDPGLSKVDQQLASILPARKIFPIQVGEKLFRLSGASISSDAPSYFSHFFEEQLRIASSPDQIRTLYIDRDPSTFEDIALHLQGYHIEPRDGPHFVRLFADAQFLSLPRLTAQLFASPIYIRVGDVEFRIPRDLFSSPGDSPNYFSLGFAILFAAPNELQAEANRQTSQRPPSLVAPSIPNRSAKTFADLLHILKGYPVEMRSPEHRQELLRDARYFHLKGLEQKLIPHEISYNLARQKQEITIRLDDIRQSGVSFVSDTSSASAAAASPEMATSPAPPAPIRPGWVHYQRPYVDSEASGLIVNINGDESIYLALAPASVAKGARIGRATFFRQTLARVTSLFSVIATKMNLPVTQPLGLMMLERGAGAASSPVSPINTGVSEDRVKIRIGTDADVTLNGRPWRVAPTDGDGENDIPASGDDRGSSGQGRARASSNTNMDRSGDNEDEEDDDEDDEDDDEDTGEDWIVRRSQWRIRVQPLLSGAGAGAGAGAAGGTNPSSSRSSGAEVILAAVKIEAYSHERGRNSLRGFLA